MKKLIKLLLFCFIISIIAASCASGYGCRGNSKYITGYKPDRYGGFTGRHH